MLPERRTRMPLCSDRQRPPASRSSVGPRARPLVDGHTVWMSVIDDVRPDRRARRIVPRSRRPSVVIGAVSLIAMVVVGFGGCGDDGPASVAVRWLPGPLQGIVVDAGGARPLVWARDLGNETAVAYELCPGRGCEEVGLIGLGGDAGDLVVVGEDLWVAPGLGGETLRVVDRNGLTRAIGPELATPTRLATSGSFVFVASGFDLYRFDPARPEEAPDLVTWTADAEGVQAIVGSFDGVWVVGHAGEVARVDPASLEVTARGRVSGSVDGAGSTAVGPNGLYVTTTDLGRDVVVRLDPTTLEVTAQRELDDTVVGAAVTTDGERVLVAAGDQLLDVDPVTLADLERHELESGISISIGVVALDGRAWVVSPLTVTIVDL